MTWLLIVLVFSTAPDSPDRYTTVVESEQACLAAKAELSAKIKSQLNQVPTALPGVKRVIIGCAQVRMA